MQAIVGLEASARNGILDLQRARGLAAVRVGPAGQLLLLKSFQAPAILILPCRDCLAAYKFTLIHIVWKGLRWNLN